VSHGDQPTLNEVEELVQALPKNLTDAQSPAEKDVSDNKRLRFSSAVALGYRAD